MDFNSLFNYYKSFGLSDEEARASANRRLGREVEPTKREDDAVGLLGGLGYGGKETAASYAGGIGAITGSRGLQDFAERVKEDAPEFTTSGKVGRAVGRLGSELALAFTGGGLALRGASKIPAIAKALAGTSRVGRGAATAAASLPIDYLQAAAYGEGAVLPGTEGALIENIALSGLAGSLFKPTARAAGAAREAAEEAAEEAVESAATAVRRRPGAPVEPKPTVEATFSRPEDPFVSTVVEPRRRTGVGTKPLEEAVEATPKLQGDQYTLFSGVPITSVDQLKSQAAIIAMTSGLGAAFGGAASEDAPLAGAAMGALAGAGLGSVGYRAFAKKASNVSSSPEQVHRAAQEDVLRRPVGEAVPTGGPRGPVPKVAASVPKEFSKEFVERGLGTTPRTLADIEEKARGLDIQDIYTRFRAGRALGAEELDAVRLELQNLTDDFTTISADLANYVQKNDVFMADAAQERLSALIERALPLEQIANNIASEAGLNLRVVQNFLGRVNKAKGKGDKNNALKQMVLGALGVKRLRPDLEDQLVNLLKVKDDTDKIVGLSKFIVSNSKSKRVDIALDWRRAGLLSRPASWFRNIVGSTENIVGEFVENPISNAFDQIMSKATGQERVFLDLNPLERFRAIKQGASKGIKDVIDNRRAYLQGIDPEEPLAVLNRRAVDYAQLFGEDSPEFIKSGLRQFQKANNMVYGIIAAGDKPFYEAAFNLSMKERGLMRVLSSTAVQTGEVAVGSKQFDDLVRQAIDIGTANSEDRVMAMFDALDATYKTSNVLSQGLRKLKEGGGALGTIADFVIPFANTPTNIVLKALERVPGVGIAFGQRYRGAIERHVKTMKAQGLDVSAGAVEKQLRRMYSKLAAKQMTGAGVIGAGYLLHKNGYITSPYTSPIGASESEREATLRRGLTGEGPLSIKIGDRTFDIAATLGTIAPLLAMGAAWSAAESDVQDQPLLSGAIAKLGAAGGAIGETILTLPLLSGAQDVVEALRGRGMARPAAMGRQAGTFVPFSAAVGGITREMDRDIGSRKPETFIEGATMNIPGLSRRVAPKVTSLGETIPASTPLVSFFNPFTERRTVSGPLYDVLEDIDLYPTAPRKLEGESEVEYAARRQEEGAVERERLNAIIESLVRGGVIDLEALATDERQREILKRALKRSLSRTRTSAARRRGTLDLLDEAR